MKNRNNDIEKLKKQIIFYSFTPVKEFTSTWWLSLEQIIKTIQ
jgi:hypothetical protein